MPVRLPIRCLLAFAAAFAVFGARAQPLPPGPPPAQQAALPSPAAVNCAKLGGRHVIRRLPRGEVGMCVFKDGRVCDAWALYRDDRCVDAVSPRRVSQ